VPRLVGNGLAKAKTKIRKAHCQVGRVTRTFSSVKKKGKVLGQSPKAGRRFKNGAKVNLTVGKGPKPKRR
jgi:eukaryotic-like serine/threonine-protein kinase